MSTAHRRLKSPRSISGTSNHPTMVTQVNIMVMNGWLTSFSFHVNQQPHSWDKIISGSDLETPRSRSWVWSKGQGHTAGPESHQLNTFPFQINQTSNSWDTAILTLKHPRSRSWVRSKVKVTYYTQYLTYALPFRFTSIGPTINGIWPKQWLTVKKHVRNFLRKLVKITVSIRKSSKSNQVIGQ